MVRQLVHTRMVIGLRNFYPQTCTIRQSTAAKSPEGQQVPSWNDLANHVDLPCRLTAGSGSQVRDVRQTYVSKLPSIALQGFFPEITEGMQAVVEGQVYKILQPRHDAQRSSTSLDVELVK